MDEKVGIRFKPCGKIYYFKANGSDIKKGDCVVVESSFGMTVGNVVTDNIPVTSEDRELKKILRKANDKDIKNKQDNCGLEKDARAFCIERIHARGLPMKLVCTEATLDRKRIIFYFTADGRIDFRELVKDLASKFKTRIELRQIGVRDETKLIGGLGMCGREVCCRTFLTGFSPISIKMAKKQELVLNTTKLSGLCGRLMCCIAFEEGEEDLSQIVTVGDSEGIPENEKMYDEYTVITDADNGRETEQGVPTNLIHSQPSSEDRKGETTAQKIHAKSTPDVRANVTEQSLPSDADQKKTDSKGKRRRRKFHRFRKRKGKKKKDE